MTTNKIRRAILTYFPNNGHRDWLKPDTFHFPPNSVRNWCAQFEECPETGTLHVHAYVEFKNGIRFATLNNKIETHTGKHGNIQKADKCSEPQRQGAVNYCTNESKRKPDTEAYIWHANQDELKFDPKFVNNPNKRQKLSRASKADSQKKMLIEYIDSKPIHWNWGQLVHENDASKLLLCTCGWGEKYHKSRIEGAKRRHIEEVIIMFGAGGTGKTTMAESWHLHEEPDMDARYYKRNFQDGAFWGGGSTSYKNEKIIHFEEFHGQELFSTWKQICDLGKVGPKINVKGAGGKLNHDTVIMTSNIHPAGWYRNVWNDDPKQFQQFSRRITRVLFFPPHKEDGSINIPDEDGPHFIDVTDDFKEFNHDFDKAKAHAADVWPLPERELTASLCFNKPL